LSGAAELSTLGHIDTPANKYPLHHIILGQGNSRRVLVAAGIHGDEPAGVETICVFFESGIYKSYLDKWELIVLPCINSYGFEHDTRENHDKMDLNRLLKVDSPPQEVTLAKSIFKPSIFDLTLELHEDCTAMVTIYFRNPTSLTELNWEIKSSMRQKK
jgi:predicted deacylase